MGLLIILLRQSWFWAKFTELQIKPFTFFLKYAFNAFWEMLFSSKSIIKSFFKKRDRGITGNSGCIDNVLVREEKEGLG